ncbi:hypothetical protein [Streptomyces tropicalis]|uniref:Uncharacterized protein n=1 Tax=Streptomyces tropicalis TaxID=3034234 RepID=A0ABT6AAY0_9ACTN|nr:hypothetical protein [Streptomyces tropicalis]MDF3301804.1 hypothetical protein [Streptomyces tropicalis]
MSVLSWLLIPLATGFSTALWGLFAGRPRRIDLWTDVDRHDRFRAVFTRQAA